MAKCGVCTHAKSVAINADLAHNLPVSRIAWKYHLRTTELLVHYAHVPGLKQITRGGIVGQLADEPSIAAPDQVGGRPCEVCAQRPFVRWKKIWQDAEGDPRERASMVAWLNEQLQSDDMGLP